MGTPSSSDETAEAAQLVYEACYLSLSGAARIERSMEMAEEVKQITLAGIAHRNPGANSREIHQEWLRILHGADMVDRLA